MDRKKIISAFSHLGKVMIALGSNLEWEKTAKNCSQELYEDTLSVINRQFHFNGWFTKGSVSESLISIGNLLSVHNIEKFLIPYTYSATPKQVGVIMAGNIPLVGFHDFLCVLLSGNAIKIKLSSDDKTLFPQLISILIEIEQECRDLITITEGKIGNIDAVIATGSNNSLQYFEQYFGKYPHIFRKNRTSVAILNGGETEEELYALGKDIFTYFGLGCRNVSQIFIPEDFDLNLLFKAILPYNSIINHHKYANNYDYNKAIHLLNLVELLDNGFILLRETDELFSPLAMLYYKRYKHIKTVEEFLHDNKENIQAVVSSKHIPFGAAQQPGLGDFADHIDTMKWLEAL